MAKAHDRIGEAALTLSAAADTIAVTAFNFYRDRAKLAAAVGFALTYSPSSAQTSPAEIQFGEALPPITHLRFVFSPF